MIRPYYAKKYGSTQIRSERFNNLIIHWNYNEI